MRPINADALKNWIDCGHLRSPNEKCYSELDVIRMLDRQPTIDYAPVVHGEWEWDTLDVYACSACGQKSHVKEVRGKPDWDFCPNCGALMDGGKKDG